jgi:8-oxo-dGTP pyrophosphatase MutT (NUDIX family)
MRTDRECAVFIRRGDRFLILHRAPPDAYWSTMAGVVEHGEQFLDAAARELREETGLAAAISDLAMPQTYVVPPALRDEYEPGVSEVTIQNYVIEVPADWEPALNDEHDDYRWLVATDAVSLVRWEETKQIIRALARGSVEPPPARA